MTVKAIPDGYHSVTPAMNVKDAPGAIAFYKKVFNAEEKVRMAAPDGTIMHAEIQIGDSIVMLSEAGHEPVHPLSSMLYVTDCDAIYARALAAGAMPKMPLMDMFWGDRAGSVIDPFGNSWYIATHKEDVSPEEMKKRMQAVSAGKPA